MPIEEKAVYIADRLREISGFQVCIIGEDILAKCESWNEVEWWYQVLKK